MLDPNDIMGGHHYAMISEAMFWLKPIPSAMNLILFTCACTLAVAVAGPDVASEVEASIASRSSQVGGRRVKRRSTTKEYIGEAHFWGRLPAATANEFCRRVRTDHANSFHPELAPFTGFLKSCCSDFVRQPP